MYPLLLAISFIFHILAFFWILLLSLRLKRSSEVEERQIEIQKEIEDMFQSYLLEMKEENEKFLNVMEKSIENKKAKTIISKSNKDIESAKNPNPNQTTTTYKPSIKAKGKMTQQAYQSQKPQKPKPSTNVEKTIDYMPPDPVDGDQLEQSLTSKVLLLHEKGFKPEEIAQQLNTGKTEIELLLKFRQQSN